MNSKDISEIAYNHLINDLYEDLHDGKKRIDLTTKTLIKKKNFYYCICFQQRKDSSLWDKVYFIFSKKKISRN